MPLFGANCRGDFVGMPTCWPADRRSDPSGDGENVIMLDLDLLLQKKTLQEIRGIAAERPVCSIPGLTFMSALSDADGNVLHIVPGQGSIYYEKPEYKILTNFSPYKQNSETHPWMGWDRYNIAKEKGLSTGVRTENGIRENCEGGNSHEDEYRKIRYWKPQIDENADRCGNAVLRRRSVPDHS